MLNILGQLQVPCELLDITRLKSVSSKKLCAWSKMLIVTKQQTSDIMSEKGHNGYLNSYLMTLDLLPNNLAKSTAVTPALLKKGHVKVYSKVN